MQLKWNAWSIYWIIVWFGLGFLVPEMYALFTDPKNTLSYQVWHLEGLDFENLFSIHTWTFGHFVVFALMIWLLMHFAFGLFR
jgi:hypothetical protein